MKIRPAALFFILLILLSCPIAAAQAFSTLTEISGRGTNSEVTFTFRTNKACSYNLVETPDSLNITFYRTLPGRSAKKPVIQSTLVDHISVTNSERDVFVIIPLRYPVKHETSVVRNPWSLTVKLQRIPDKVFKKSFDGRIEFIKVIRQVKRGYAEANLLKVDPSSTEVFPAIATHSREDPSLLEKILKLFTFSPDKEEPRFVRQRVSSIAKERGAGFAVNGTFFTASGRPLGLLMIDEDLIAAPIMERTAFAITKDGCGYIDNFFDNNYAMLPDGVKIDLTTLNRERRDNEVLLYTQRYGRRTGTDGSGIEFTVVDGRITQVKNGDSDIPKRGVVLSFSSRFKKIAEESLKSGRNISVRLNLMPISGNGSAALRHIIGGGPRLVKSGMIYVAKKEERFQRDVADSRAARTAVAIDGRGNYIFVVVDGRPRYKTGEPHGVGMTLEELSELLIDYGAVEAMNLDGGGSSTMIVDGELKNRPANGFEVGVNNAILIRPLSSSSP